MVAFTLALPIIIDLVYHLFSAIAIVLVPGAKTNLAEVEELAAPYGHHGHHWWFTHGSNEIFGLWIVAHPEHVKMWKCSTISTCYCWDRWKIKQGVFWFRQRSTFLPEIVENEYQWSTFTTRKWTSFSMYCGKPIKPSLPLGDALCSGLPEN